MAKKKNVSKDRGKSLRFNVYLSRKEYEEMQNLSIARGDNSLAQTIRMGLSNLKILEENAISTDNLVAILSLYDAFAQETKNGKHIIIENPQTKERTRLLIPKIK